MSIKIIRVNQHRIRANINKEPVDLEPPISIKSTRRRKVIYGNNIKIYDSNNNVVAEIVYRPNKPLSCGARVWIIAKGPISVDDAEMLV
jgi:hypothetical protein